ncbi:Disks large-associated protein 1 [Anthophora plagiata]
MTSQESIGSCSLDVDQSASDRSENTVDTISKKTLHSLNLSCNGDSVSSPDNLANGSSETLQKSHLTPDEKLNVSNGHRSSPEPEQLTVKKPSYLGLACSISGYSGINRYDSKLREGFRSRDSSPGTRLITRDTSPAGFRSNENLNVPVHPYPPKSQSISPLAMDRQNGFANGLKEECKIEAYRETRNSISICQGYSEVDKGVMHSAFADISPIRPTTPAKRSPGMSQMMSCGQQNKHFSGSSPKQATANISNTSFSDTSILNGSTAEVENQILNNSSSSEKSFIQQRVERLYGPGALAQGFFFKRSTNRLNNSESNFNKSSNNNDVSTENANTEESLKNLPVLRHLRPEFRAQLPVVSPRRPTDGSEQILKPLQRVTPVSRKVEQKPKIPAATNLDGNLADSGAQKLNSSVTSIPDQQPAAPKVVLPVLEPSASSSNVAKQVQEAEKTVEVKNGHYFIKLLKQETDRLLSLAASAEAELTNGDTVALPEEAAGKLRSAAGKARLLASQKMQQFEGLCQKNIIQVPGEEFPTTNEDLAGFWDMVMLQVVQVNELFDHIEKLRNSQWQETVPEKKAVTVSPQNGTTGKRRVTPIHKPKSTANSEANKKAREAREQARRQLIEERRRAMRSNAQNSENTVKIFAPDT